MALQIEPEPDDIAPNGHARRGASVVAIVFMLLGVWICLEALQVPFGGFRMPGAGFFPVLLGLTLSALALVLLGMTLFGSSSKVIHIWPERPEVLYLIGAILVSAYLFERAGFLLSMALFLGVVMKVLGHLPGPTAVLLALLGSVVSYFVFGHLLQIALPSGILPF